MHPCTAPSFSRNVVRLKVPSGWILPQTFGLRMAIGFHQSDPIVSPPRIVPRAIHVARVIVFEQ
jgi:hypothetical protein